MRFEFDLTMTGMAFQGGDVALGRPSNDDFPEVSFEEAVERFRYWKYTPEEELRSFTFVQHAWRRKYLEQIAELEQRLRTVF